MKTVMVFSGNNTFPASHSASICELPNGDLITAWFSGSRESASDSVILGSRLKKDAENWEIPKVLVNVHQRAAGNPRLFLGPDNGLWLIAPINYGKWCDGGSRLFLKRSYDLGRTWTDLEIFTGRKRILGKNKPIFVQPNIWIIPVEYEGTGDVAFMRSTNRGKTWSVIDCKGDGFYLDQPTVVELKSGTLLGFMRSWEGYIFKSYSYDKGQSWTKPEQTEIYNPNSGIDMICLDDGRLLLAYNPVALGPEGNLTNKDVKSDRLSVQQNQKALEQIGAYELDRMIDSKKASVTIHQGGYLAWGPRTPLCIGVSDDEGLSWRNAVVLEDGPGEYSYPALIVGKDDQLHIVYTFLRKGIKYCQIGISEI